MFSFEKTKSKNQKKKKKNKIKHSGMCSLPAQQLLVVQKFLSNEENISAGMLSVGNKVVKNLIKSFTQTGTPLPVNDLSPHLVNLCIFMTHVLWHGLRGGFLFFFFSQLLSSPSLPLFFFLVPIRKENSVVHKKSMGLFSGDP